MGNGAGKFFRDAGEKISNAASTVGNFVREQATRIVTPIITTVTGSQDIGNWIGGLVGKFAGDLAKQITSLVGHGVTQLGLWFDNRSKGIILGQGWAT